MVLQTNFVDVFFAISLLSPLGKGRDPLFGHTRISLIREWWLKLAHWFWKRIFLKMLSMYFAIYLFRKKEVALHLNKLELPSPKNAVCQIWLKLALCFWRGRFLWAVCMYMYFCYFAIISTLKMVWFNLNSLIKPKCHMLYKIQNLHVAML